MSCHDTTRTATAVRPVTTAVDLEAARELFREYAASLDFDLAFQGFGAELAGLPGDYSSPRGALLLGLVGDRPVGCVALRPLDSGTAELKRLYVRPEGRGRGLGRRLVTAALERATAAGYERVRLDTVPSMADAARLYRSLGFRDIPPYRANPIAGAAYLELALPHTGAASIPTECVMTDDHDAIILDQFTRQAAPFAAVSAHADADILDLIRLAGRLTPAAQVLDVACGPGLVALALAPHAAHVTGLDVTPAMLDKARDLQRVRNVANASWAPGRADALPFPDATFDAVVTRWSFHHLQNPAAALAEMIRVCRPGGRVVVADVYTTTAEQGAEYDRLERLRDPSHTRALVLNEFRELVRAGAIADVSEAFSRLPLPADDLLASSFPVPGGADEFRRAGAADVGLDRSGLGFHLRDGRLFVSFPSVVFAGTRPA